MTRIFFYHGAQDKLRAVCHLLSKAASQKKPVIVFTPDMERCAQLDRLLWTFEAQSFVPHCLAHAEGAAETPILLAPQLDNPQHQERVLNLAHDVPPAYQRFNSLIEVVSTDEEDRQLARTRVAQYRQDGCEIQFIDLSPKPA